MLFCYITCTDMLCTVSVTRTLVNKKFMETQNNVLGKWARHSQFVYFGQIFWGDYNE